MTATQSAGQTLWVEMRGMGFASSWKAVALRDLPGRIVHAADFNPAELDEETRLVFVYRRGIDWLTKSMAEGVAPSRAIDLWTQTAGEFAGQLRGVRHRAALIEAGAFERDPVGTVGVLGLDPPSEEVGAPAETASDGLYRLIAAHLLATRAAARRLDAELEASALAIDAPAPRPIDPDRVYASAMRGIKFRTDLAKSANENLQRELAEKKAELARLTAQLNNPGGGEGPARTTAGHTGGGQQDRDKLASENDALKKKLFAMQQELEEQFVLAKEARLTVQELEAEVAKMLRSKSWRVTEPFRRARRLLVPPSPRGS